MRTKTDDKEDRAEIARGKPPSRAEEAREDRTTTGRAASRTMANLVAKTKKGQGTLTYTPGRPRK